MGNTIAEENSQYTKQYLRFIIDGMRIFMYCGKVLSPLDMSSISSHINVIASQSSEQKPRKAEEAKLFQTLLDIRSVMLRRFFEGAFLSNQQFIFRVHEYSYLQECIQSPKKILSREKFAIFAASLAALKQKSEYDLSDLTFEELRDNSLDFVFFEDTFFRQSSTQTIRLSDFYNNPFLLESTTTTTTSSTSPEASPDAVSNAQPIFQEPRLQLQYEIQKTGTKALPSQSLSRSTNNINNSDRSKLSLQRMNRILRVQQMKEPLMLMPQEFQQLQKIFQKNQHKITQIHQIPPIGIVSISDYLRQLTCVKELRISTALDRSLINELVTFLDDDLSLEVLHLNCSDTVTSRLIDRLNNHPKISYISLYVHSLDQDLKNLKHLRELMVRPCDVSNVLSIVNPSRVALKFEMSQSFRFTAQTLKVLNAFELTLISASTTFPSLSQVIFGCLPSKEAQTSLLRDLINSDNIVLDPCMNFPGGCYDWKRIKDKSLVYTKGLLYMFLLDLYLTYSEESLLAKLRIFAHHKIISPFMQFHSNNIFLDLYY